MSRGAIKRLCAGLVAMLAAPLALADLSGDAARGAQLATACANCHGQRGEGLAVSGFPRLAGQPAPYLAKQLHDFVAGTRDNPVMLSFAQKLSEQDMADLAAHFAGLKAPAAVEKPVARAPAQGRVLANLGDAKAGVPACGNCHGPNGRGEPPALPYLAGQHARYIVSQLEAWQKGSRHNDGGAQMATLARKLSAGDIDAVAEYFAQQTPP